MTWKKTTSVVVAYLLRTLEQDDHRDKSRLRWQPLSLLTQKNEAHRHCFDFVRRLSGITLSHHRYIVLQRKFARMDTRLGRLDRRFVINIRAFLWGSSGTSVDVLYVFRDDRLSDQSNEQRGSRSAYRLFQQRHVVHVR